MEKSLIYIIIPNWNGLEWLKLCLPSIEKNNYLNYKTLVVDNGSEDGSVKWIKKNYPVVEIIKNKNNLGFAEGMNVGIRHALSNEEVKYIAALNNDIKIDEDWLKELVSTAQKYKRAGMIASKMLSLCNPSIIDSCGIKVFRRGNAKDIGKGEEDRGQYDIIKKVFGPCAGAALYIREALEKTRINKDYYDSDYFAYFEDVDLAWRIRLAGYDCIFNPKAIVYHKGRGTSSENLKRFRVWDLGMRNSINNLIKNASYSLLLHNYKYFLKLWIMASLNLFKIKKQYDDVRFKPLFEVLASLAASFKKRKLIRDISTLPRKEVEKLLET